jgi:hypothetical protein
MIFETFNLSVNAQKRSQRTNRNGQNNMENSTYFTIGQAAKETGKAKSTIKKSIDNGELSVAEKTARGFKIEASELFSKRPVNPT